MKTEPFYQPVLSVTELARGLNCTSATWSEDHKRENRERNICTIASGWIFQNTPVDQITNLLRGDCPRTISLARTPLDNLVAAYDYLVQDAQSIAARHQCYAERLYMLAIMLMACRHEYGTGYERELRRQANAVTGGEIGVPDGWSEISRPLYVYIINPTLYSWTVGGAAILSILAHCWRIAPALLPFADFSPVLRALLSRLPWATIEEKFFIELRNVMADIYQVCQRQLRTSVDPKIMPLLELLSDGKEQSAKSLVAGVGATPRSLFLATLTSALKESLVVMTEENPNSPRQKYRLADKGKQALQQAKGVVL